MSFTLASVPRRRPGVELEYVGEEAVMLDAHGTVARGLNASAARVWELIDGRRSVAEILAALPAEATGEQVLGFLQALFERGLVDG
ncbi:MAG: PqqD family protein [Archangiaceae bacterium]|nr:PqqD family protein [Archangiaceae bacterium]